MIDVAALLSEPFPVPPHAMMALGALALGAVQLAAPKGTGAHRLVGYAWVGLMAGTALTALFIYDLRMIGPFSPIHLLIPLLLVNLWRGVTDVRRGDVDAHRAIMRSLFWWALVVAGVFTLLPGRAMHTVLFEA